MATLFRGRYWRNNEIVRLDDRLLLQFKSRPRSLRVIPQRSDSDRPAPPFIADDPAWQDYYDRLRQSDRPSALRAIRRIDSAAAKRLARCDTAAILQEYGNLLATIAEVALDSPTLRLDSAPPVKRVAKWQGLEVGITHEDGDSRFPGGRPLMGCAYGHLRRSYPRASDGKAIDVYLGGDSPRAFRVYQKDPHSGVIDEHKVMLGFSDIDEARAAYTRHAGLGRFGGIEAIDLNTVADYRIDACGCKTIEDARTSGGAILDAETADRLAIAPDDERPALLLSVLQDAYPTEILGLTKWQIESNDGVPEYTGEFATPLGVYAWRISPQKGRLAYRWKRELASSLKNDSFVFTNPATTQFANPATTQESFSHNSFSPKKTRLSTPRSRRKRTDTKKPDPSILDSDDADIGLGDWLAVRARKAIAPWVKEVEAFAQECGSLEAMRDRLPELFDRLPASQLFEAYDRAMTLAYRLGQGRAEL